MCFTDVRHGRAQTLTCISSKSLNLEWTDGRNHPAPQKIQCLSVEVVPERRASEPRGRRGSSTEPRRSCGWTTRDGRGHSPTGFLTASHADREDRNRDGGTSSSRDTSQPRFEPSPSRLTRPPHVQCSLVTPLVGWYHVLMHEVDQKTSNLKHILSPSKPPTLEREGNGQIGSPGGFGFDR